MTTIPDTIKIISKNIQDAFEELIKVLLRKTIKPVTNNLGQNRIIYNSYTCRYERGYIGNTLNDNINKYVYQMSNSSLGWSDEIFVTFKITPKTIKSTILKRFPATSTTTANKSKTNAKILFSEETRYRTLKQYSNFVRNISTRNINNVISSNNTHNIYSVDVPYTKSFKQLENIGRDIMDQSNSSVPLHESIKMSTSELRMNLCTLENSLANFSIDYPDIFDSYIEMIRIVNSVPKNKIPKLINFIGTIEYKLWEDLDQRMKIMYINIFGDEFIETFISNNLISILLQTHNSDLILTASYLYPLLKMLFSVFGFSRLTPIITGISCYKCKSPGIKNKINKYQNCIMRKGLNSLSEQDEDYQFDDNSSVLSDSLSNINYNGQYKRAPEIEPIADSVYNFIKTFGNFYPTLVGLMGGTETFPPENFEVNCNDIIGNYSCLSSIPEYLWRFNDFSYCRYLEFLQSKQLESTINFKVNNKVQYLKSL